MIVSGFHQVVPDDALWDYRPTSKEVRFESVGRRFSFGTKTRAFLVSPHHTSIIIPSVITVQKTLLDVGHAHDAMKKNCSSARKEEWLFFAAGQPNKFTLLHCHTPPCFACVLCSCTVFLCTWRRSCFSLRFPVPYGWTDEPHNAFPPLNALVLKPPPRTGGTGIVHTTR